MIRILIHVTTKLLVFVLALRLGQLLGRRRLWEWRNGGYHIKLKAPLDDIPHGSKEGRLPIQETVGLSPLSLCFFASAYSLHWGYRLYLPSKNPLLLSNLQHS